MVSKIGLKLRMVITGTLLFGLYAAAAGLAFFMFGGGPVVLGLILVGSLAFVGLQYRIGRWAALRSVGAEDMPEEGRYRDVHRSVERLSERMEIDKPRLMVAEMGVPNAFAVGRKGAGVVVISEEIIHLLDHDELEGVIAHELAHIKNRDVVVMLLGQSIASIVGIVVQWIVLFTGERNIGSYFVAMFAGMIANMLVMIIVMAISRYREYVADGDAAQYTGNPDAMARALEKISSGAEGREMEGGDAVNAMAIFPGNRGVLQTLFATHPPVQKRIQRLRGV